MKRFVGFGILLFIVSIFIPSVKHLECFGSNGEITLPKTGQTTSYAIGDDGDLQKGAAWPSPRFEDMSNGTIRDNLTGLIWLKNGNCTANLGGVNKTGPLSWQDALTWTNNLSSGNCGLTDGSNAGQWRLPNINELKSLVNVGFKEGGFCDGSQCDSLALWLNYRGFENVEANYYWSSTTYPAISGYAWITNMAIGNTGGYDKTELNYVLPVRGGQDGVPDSNYPANIPKTGQTTCYDASGNTITCTDTGQDGDLQKGVTWPSPRFEVIYCSDTSICPNPSTECDTPPNQNNDMILDKLTGLYWPRDGSIGGGKTWADALTYANTFTLCGMSGWRLPNLNERVSLMNFGQSNMSAWLNANNFDVPQSYFWTSSTGTATPTNAWYTAMGGGAISTIAKTNNYYAWPVKSSCASPPSDMVSWWRAEDNANDSIGSNNGTSQGGLTYVSGKVGKAFSFNGTNSYVDLGSWFNYQSFSIEMWINPDSSQVDWANIIDNNHDGSKSWVIQQNGANVNQYEFGAKGGGLILFNLPANQWSHLVATRDTNRLNKVYINGVLVGSYTSTEDIPYDGSQYLRLGKWGGGDRYWKGLMDEVTIYNRALTTQEIAAIYSAGSGGKCLTRSLTVTKAGTGSGTVNATGCTLNWDGNTGTCTVNSGTAITLSGSADAGSTFAGWSGGTGSANCTGTGTCSFDITQNSSVTATFTLNQYTVTANAGGNGTGTVSSNTGGISYSYPANNTATTSALNHGTNVVLTATAGAGSTVSWTTCPGGTTAGNGTTIATCTFNNLDATKTAQATFTLNQYTLTVTKAGTGSGTVTGGSNCTLTWSGAGNNTGTCTVNSGTLINLSASAGSNSIFTGWSGGTGSASGCTGTVDCIFSLNDDSQITSFFNDINHIGQVYVNHGSGSVNSVYIGSMNADKDVYIVGPGAGSSQGSYALEYRSWTPLVSGNLIRVNFNGASFTGVPINLCLGSNNTNVGSSNPSAGATNDIFALSNYVANSDFIYFTDSACGSANRNRFPVRLLATNTPKMTTVRVDALTSGGIILDSTPAANLIEITSTAPQLNITKAGSGTGNVTASGCTLNWSGNTGTCSVASGGNVTISATADGSSTFVGFTGAGCVGTSNCEVNNITSNKYLTATFRTNGAGNQINLPQTGQSTSYDSNTPKFDDGALRTGQYWPTSRFITNSPTGTVIDKLTGLMWLAAGNTPTIGSCTGGVKTWTDALDYVTCLNNNNYLDFSDWRLPNVNELASLFHSGQSNSATWLNSQGFSNIPTASAWYWTSTTNTAATSSAIAIATDSGSFVSDPKTNTNYTIAVRTSSYSPVLSKVARTGQTTSYDATRYGEDGDIQYGEPMPATRFSSSGSIVTDNLTGLKWASAANNPTVGSCTGGAMNWQATANYVSCLNNSNYLGYNDWRVPNKNELRSLIDYQNTAPALPSGYNSHFTSVQNSTYWTSTTVPGATTSAYTVNFSTGLLSNIVKTNTTPYVIPVRGGNISVVVSVSGSGVVKDSTNTINCGSQCDGSFEFSANNPIQFSFIPNSGKSLTSVVVNGMNIGPVHSLKIRSRTQYLDIQATFSP